MSHSTSFFDLLPGDVQYLNIGERELWRLFVSLRWEVGIALQEGRSTYSLSEILFRVHQHRPNHPFSQNREFLLWLVLAAEPHEGPPNRALLGFQPGGILRVECPPWIHTHAWRLERIFQISGNIRSSSQKESRLNPQA